MHTKQKASLAAIKEAFLINLHKFSFEDLTVSHISQTAQLHRSTFYAHFPHKQAMLDSYLRDIQNQVQSLLPQDGPPDSYLEPLTQVFAYLAQEKDLLLALKDHSRHILERFLLGLLEDLSQSILPLAQSLQSPSLLPLEFGQALYLYKNVGLLLTWIDMDCRQSPDTMAQYLLFANDLPKGQAAD